MKIYFLIAMIFLGHSKLSFSTTDDYFIGDYSFGGEEEAETCPEYDPNNASHQAKAFILDLDGTIYQPGSLIPGAKEFFEWVEKEQIPFVLLSNTGSKCKKGTISKLSKDPYKISQKIIDKCHVLTAAEAQADYMVENIPPFSKILVVAGGEFWKQLLKERNVDLVETWDIKTELDIEEAKEWAVLASNGKKSNGQKKVVVSFFLDAEVKEKSKWNFDVFSYLVNHGALFIYTADDPYNPTIDARFPDKVFPIPGPGMFAAAIKSAIPLGQEDAAICCGKGGSHGDEYMTQKAIKMLQSQGYEGEIKDIMIVGDRLSTDISAGCKAGIKSCLVESGCDNRTRIPFSSAKPTYWAHSIAFLSPLVDTENLSAMQRSKSVLEQISKMPLKELIKTWYLERSEGNSVYLSAYFNKILKAKSKQCHKTFTFDDMIETCKVLNISREIVLETSDLHGASEDSSDISEEKFIDIMEKIGDL